MAMYAPPHHDRLADQLREWKEKREAVILAHNYQKGEVQDVADFVGDSLALAQQAAEVRDVRTIVLCGVRFMAETAKLVNPERTVLMPDENAGCPMADMITPHELREARQRYPDATVVCYVNSSAETKALSDICCTSANAVRIVDSIPREKPVIFVPDQRLGDYVARQLDRELILWPGYCPTHHRILPEDIERRRSEHPDAKVLVHPECTEDVRRLADFVGSTSQMLRYAAETDVRTLVIGTEGGICHTLRKQNPEKTIVHVSRLADCPNMKLTTVEKVLWSLQNTQHEVTVPAKTAERARRAIDRMLELS